jgi:hypothetical protein
MTIGHVVAGVSVLTFLAVVGWELTKGSNTGFAANDRKKKTRKKRR